VEVSNLRHPDKKIITLHGIVTHGTGEAGAITELPWVREQFIHKLGINPYPGTFNLTILAEDIDKLNAIRKSKGIEITPKDKNHCTGIGFPALVAGKIKGAIIIPLVPNYPPAQLEIISSQNIRHSLSVEDGDLIEIEAYL
jgi:CTP-dependent riboflavin kinase